MESTGIQLEQVGDTKVLQFFSPKLDLRNFYQLPKNLEQLVGNNHQPISLSSYFYFFSTELKSLNRADCNSIMFSALDQAECTNEPDSNTIPYTWEPDEILSEEGYQPGDEDVQIYEPTLI